MPACVIFKKPFLAEIFYLTACAPGSTPELQAAVSLAWKHVSLELEGNCQKESKLLKLKNKIKFSASIPK